MNKMQIMNRNEMKHIMAGNCPSCASCATDCLNLYSGYHTLCSETYDHYTDDWSKCHAETHDLNNQCINDCFQVN